MPTDCQSKAGMHSAEKTTCNGAEVGMGASSCKMGGMMRPSGAGTRAQSRALRRALDFLSRWFWHGKRGTRQANSAVSDGCPLQTEKAKKVPWPIPRRPSWSRRRARST